MLCYLSDHANLHPQVSVGGWAKNWSSDPFLICVGQGQVLQSGVGSRSAVFTCLLLQSVMCPTGDSVFVLKHSSQEMFQAVPLITSVRCLDQFRCHGFVCACA